MIVAASGFAGFAYLLIGIGVWIGLVNRGQPRVLCALVALIWPAFALARLGVWIGED